MTDHIETLRERRGHRFFPVPTDGIPPMYSTEKIGSHDKTVVAHYFVGACDWWIVEYDEATAEAFGFACIGDRLNAEWGYIPLVELEAINLKNGLYVVERDLHWTPRPFRDCLHACDGRKAVGA